MNRYIAVPLAAWLWVGCSKGDGMTSPGAGELLVTVTTTGGTPDDDGYLLGIDDTPGQAIAANATVQRTELEPGAHTLHLTGVDPSCTVRGENPRTVTVVAEEETGTTFEVSCTTVDPNNHPPVAHDNVDVLHTVVGVPYRGNVFGEDEDGDPLTYTLVEATRSGTLDFKPDGSFVYTPNPRYTGLDVFTFRVSDGAAESNVATIDIWVNTPPVAVPDTFRVAAGATLRVAAPGILANDSDRNDDPLAALQDTDPAHGTIKEWDTYGGFTYTPKPGFVGTDAFLYRAAEDLGMWSYESPQTKVVIIVK